MKAKCPVCSRPIDPREKDAFFSNCFYYHRGCYLNSSEKEKLMLFIKGFYGVAKISSKIISQIENFMNTYRDMSYKDIEDSLIYFHRTKRNPIVERDTIGIVPIIYLEARSHMLIAQLANASMAKGIKRFRERKKEREPISIIAPKRRRKLYDLELICEDMESDDANGSDYGRDSPE